MENGICKNISVIIPCLNEEASIGQVVDDARSGIEATGLEGEVIVVDNGSHDHSAAIAADHGARVIEESVKGYGAAIRRGFAAARGDILVMGDADMTYDFTKLGDLTEPIAQDEADFVVGNRMNNIKPGAMPTLHRYIGNPLLSMLLRLLFNKHIVRDAHCGLRAVRTSSYRQMNCVTNGMEFASEMVVRAIHLNLRMQERDIIYHPRVGDSKLSSFRDGWRHLRFMMLHSPTPVFVLPGLVTWLIGLVIVVPLAFGPIIMGAHRFDVHFMLMGGLLNVLSIQFIVMGMLAKAFAHLNGLRKDPVIAWLYRHLTFDKFLIYSGLLALIGMLVLIKVIFQWIGSEFGSLDEVRTLFLGILLMINAAQLGSAGYLFSIMALRHHNLPLDEYQPAANRND